MFYSLFFRLVVREHATVTNRFINGFYKKYTYATNHNLYKKLAFIGLSLNIMLYSKFYSPTIKSLMYSTWDSVKANIFII